MSRPEGKLERYKIEVYDGWDLKDNMKPLRIAEITEHGKRKPLVKIVDADDVRLFDALAVWVRKGCPSREELGLKETAR